jgi:hypothetical protein
MKSAGPEPGTSRVEISDVTAKGFRLRLGDEKLNVSFTEFPWFRKATVAELNCVECPSPDHLYWPSLDIDLAVESIRHPERFPLVSRISGRG